jgi:deoxyribodipyrimidine photo-lyase
VQEEHIRRLHEKDTKSGDYVPFWIQEAQRAEYNHALEYAAQWANELEQRLLGAFGLTEAYPEDNLRRYTFMLEELKDVEEALKEKIVPVVRRARRTRSRWGSSGMPR